MPAAKIPLIGRAQLLVVVSPATQPVEEVLSLPLCLLTHSSPTQECQYCSLQNRIKIWIRRLLLLERGPMKGTTGTSKHRQQRAETSQASYRSLPVPEGGLQEGRRGTFHKDV